MKPPSGHRSPNQLQPVPPSPSNSWHAVPASTSVPPPQNNLNLSVGKPTSPLTQPWSQVHPDSAITQAIPNTTHLSRLQPIYPVQYLEESDIDTDAGLDHAHSGTPPEMLVSSCGEGLDCPSPPHRSLLHPSVLDSGLGLGLDSQQNIDPRGLQSSSDEENDIQLPLMGHKLLTQPGPKANSSALRHAGPCYGDFDLPRVHDYSPSEQEEDDD